MATSTSTPYCHIDKILASFCNTDADPWLKPYVCLGVTKCNNADTFASFSKDAYLDLEVLKSNEPTTSLNSSAKFGIYMSLCEIFRGALLTLMWEQGKYDNSELKLTVGSLQKYLENCEVDTGKGGIPN